jgi:hypothetical protein
MKYYSQSKSNITGLQITAVETFAIIGLLTELARRNDSNSSRVWQLRSRMIVEMGKTYPDWNKILDALPFPDSPNDESENAEEDTEYDAVDGW